MAIKDFDSREFRTALSGFATGVTIVTAAACGGEKVKKVGMTASSFNSVSMDPPLIFWRDDRLAAAGGSGKMKVACNKGYCSATSKQRRKRVYGNHRCEPRRTYRGFGNRLTGCEVGGLDPPITMRLLELVQLNDHTH